MQVVYHLGAHCTDEDRLLKCLLNNKGPLGGEGILVPGPGRYRTALREAMISLRGAPASAEAEQALLNTLTDGAQGRRLILSNASFLSAPDRALDANAIYAAGDQKSFWLTQIFPSAQAELFLAIRNPATYIPALFEASRAADFRSFIRDIPVRTLRWSDTVRRMRDANPDAMLTVWCNEDTPLIWTELLQRLSGHPPGMHMDGADDFVAGLMSKNGLKRMRDYIQRNPPGNELQRRRITAAFLDKFALPEEIELEIDLPGWSEDLIEDLTEIYEEDLFEIERMDGITFITP